MSSVSRDMSPFIEPESSLPGGGRY